AVPVSLPGAERRNGLYEYCRGDLCNRSPPQEPPGVVWISHGMERRGDGTRGVVAGLGQVPCTGYFNEVADVCPGSVDRSRLPRRVHPQAGDLPEFSCAQSAHMGGLAFSYCVDGLDAGTGGNVHLAVALGAGEERNKRGYLGLCPL